MRKPKPNPITLLPFVKNRRQWTPKDRLHPRDFWAEIARHAAYGRKAGQEAV